LLNSEVGNKNLKIEIEAACLGTLGILFENCEIFNYSLIQIYFDHLANRLSDRNKEGKHGAIPTKCTVQGLEIYNLSLRLLRANTPFQLPALWRISKRRGIYLMKGNIIMMIE
jgi:hypothetical protein